ncbi:MAG: inositol 2-dehydrogenase [Stappiaceae bacterium]
MVGIALLGAGRIGQVHAKTLVANNDVDLIAIADAYQPAADALAAQTGAMAVPADDVFSNPSVEAVLVASSTDTHADYIDQAAAAGKAVFCEKPVDMSSDRIRQCLEKVDAAGVPLMIGFNRRFDRHLGELKQRIDTGAVGDVELVTILSRDPTPPPLDYVKRSGGLFRDMMIHDFDMARFLLGEEPVEIHAMGSSLIDPEIGRAGDVDTAVAQMKTASGKICQISCSRRATYGYDQRIEVHGSEGMIRAKNVHETNVELANTNGFIADRAKEFFLERYMEAYERELAVFVDVVTKGTAPSPSGYDGLMAQVLADSATVSAQEGRMIKL